MSTEQQDREFIGEIFSNVLEDSINWIGANMNPEDVFSVKDLDEWARENGYHKD